MIRLVLIVLAGTAAASAFAAGGPAPPGTTNSVFAPGSTVMYTTRAHNGHTTVSVWRNGRTTWSVEIRGSFGVPVPTQQGGVEGVSHNGRTLLLAWIRGRASKFAVLDVPALRLRRMVELPGRFSYDALSPDARNLFLIQLSSDSNHYYVRSYDVAHGRLDRRIVSDAREKAGPMSGLPITRVTGPSGRWVFTLYSKPTGGFFVHALDTGDRHAFCIDLPRAGSSSSTSTMRLQLRPGRLSVMQGSARLAAIDTKTLRVTKTGRP
jgi:hypothetical protein